MKRDRDQASLPESIGGKIPSNAFDLMRELRAQERGDVMRSRRQQKSNRELKQELKQQTIERKLMEGEDYTFTEEGKRRFRAMEERVFMEAEDFLSDQINKQQREFEADIFRKKIRREAEARRRQDEAEREEKRMAAERRRQAVVDRIRKQQQEEERRAQEAATARQKEIETKKRLEEVAAEALRANRAAMEVEDDLSTLNEQLFKEQQEREEWLWQEAKKLAEWEKEQQQKDELDRKKRKQKLLELEEKKRKLAEIKKSQHNDESARQNMMVSVRNEALKMNKQLRIQNKAKFVSKKRSQKQKDLFSETLQLPKPNNMADRAKFSSTHVGNISKEFKTNASVDEENFEIDTSKYDNLQSETELHGALKELMAEKRGLRLQLIQKKSATRSVEDVAEVKSIQTQISSVGKLEKYVQERLEEVIRKETVKNSNVHSGSVSDIVKAECTSLAGQRRLSHENIAFQDVKGADDAVYRDIEFVLRESNHLLMTASAIEAFHQDVKALDDVKRKAGLLKMKGIDYVQKVKQRVIEDINGYEDRLNEAINKLNGFLEKLLDSESEKPKTPRSRSGSVQHSQSLPALDSVSTSQNVSISHSVILRDSPQVGGSSDVVCSDTKWGDVRTAVQHFGDDAIFVKKGYGGEEEESTTRLFKMNTEKDECNKYDTLCSSAKPEEVSENCSRGMSRDIDDEENDEDDIDYERVEGWNECLHTTMATAAHHAAFYGYTRVLKILSKFFDVFIMDNNGRTPLFYACLRNNLDCVLLLVSINSLWIEVGDIKGETCMHAAVKANGVEVLSFLLTCEVDSNIANYEGMTPAHLARSLPLLSALHDAGSTLYCVDSLSRMPLWYAARDGLKDNAELLCSVMPLEYITWQDADGNSPLHIACIHGQSEVVEVISMWISKLEDFYILNNKNYTPSHVATTADVLRKLYEFGVDLWVADPKGRYPLFMNSFHGRTDCVTLLVELGVAKNKNFVTSKDKQGDSALHAAAMCGHFNCVLLLLYWLDNERNKQGLTPLDLAKRAKHTHITALIEHVESKRAQNETTLQIFRCSFDSLAAVTLAHGSRWTKVYDSENDSVYYYDRILLVSQWERPQLFDENLSQEEEIDKVRCILKKFYDKYNPDKLFTINDIIHVYKHNFAELFVQLAERYNVQDLSIFYG